MKIKPINPPRYFFVGKNNEIRLADCGKVFLESDEMVSLVTEKGREYDLVAKSWGFYATPSINGRLKKEGFKTALVKNMQGFLYVMIVEPEKMEEFIRYIRSEQSEIQEWLDEK